MDLTETITNLCDELGWNVNVYEEDPVIVELEAWTGLGGDEIVYLDMRDKDLGDPDAWAREARDMADCFDPEEEAVAWYGKPDAPSLTEMLDDYKAFKSEMLEPTAEHIEKAMRELKRGKRQ